jgi:hypothetical protein
MGKLSVWCDLINLEPMAEVRCKYGRIVGFLPSYHTILEASLLGPLILAIN